MSEIEMSEMETQTLVLNRTTGELEASKPSFTTGVGALLTRIAGSMKKTDRTEANDSMDKGESVTNELDVTIIDNNTGAATRHTANGTVGADTEGVRFNRFGTKSALALLLAKTGFTRDTISENLIAALKSDDVPAICELMGVSETALTAANELIEIMGEESVVTVSGRQQVSKVQTTDLIVG